MIPLTYSPTDYDTFVGIDVDKNSFSFTIQDHAIMNHSRKMPSNPEQLHRYIQDRFLGKRVLYAYEAGPTGFHLHDYLREKAQSCFVVAPLSIPKAGNERVKNNRIDSRKIAQHLKSGNLKPIRVPYGGYRELRHLIQMREEYARNRKVAKQRIKSLLLYTNLHSTIKDTEQNWSYRYLTRLKTVPCSFAVRQRLDMLLADLDYARKQTLAILRQLRIFCNQQPDINRNIHYLESIPGIGFITAASLLGRIGNPEYLRNVRELAAFIGLVPTEKSTGDTVNQGSITHLGNRVLRSLLVECAWVAIRRDTELRQFYHRIKRRHHPKIAAKKAIVAVARKLTLRIYRVLKDQRCYVAR